MKTFITCFLLCLCYFSYSAEAQDERPIEDGKLTTLVILGQSTILPYEAVSVLASIGNETLEPIVKAGYGDYKPTGFTDDLGISILSEANSANGWNTFVRSSLTGSPPPQTAKKQIFAPGETYYYFTWLGADYKGQSPFSQPGRYRIKAGGNFDNSIEEVLTVVEPKGADAEALKDLEAQKLYLCFTLDSIKENFDSSESIEPYDLLLESFIKKHPDSHYAQWARWGQMLVRTRKKNWRWPYLRGWVAEEGLSVTQDYQQRYENMAPQFSPFLRANSLYRAGVLALLNGDAKKGNSLLEQATALKADATLPRQIALVKQQIEKYPRLVYVPVPAKSEDQFQQVVEKLTRERYNVRSLELLPKIQAEYYSKILALNARHREGELSIEQFEQEGAKLFEFYIRTYAKPLSPEEWKLLQEKQKNVAKAAR